MPKVRWKYHLSCRTGPYLAQILLTHIPPKHISSATNKQKRPLAQKTAHLCPKKTHRPEPGSSIAWEFLTRNHPSFLHNPTPKTPRYRPSSVHPSTILHESGNTEEIGFFLRNLKVQTTQRLVEENHPRERFDFISVCAGLKPRLICFASENLKKAFKNLT